MNPEALIKPKNNKAKRPLSFADKGLFKAHYNTASGEIKTAGRLLQALR